jgi:hypothetical protein
LQRATQDLLDLAVAVVPACARCDPKLVAPGVAAAAQVAVRAGAWEQGAAKLLSHDHLMAGAQEGGLQDGSQTLAWMKC